jgi:hypothetical protein
MSRTPSRRRSLSAPADTRLPSPAAFPAGARQGPGSLGFLWRLELQHSSPAQSKPGVRSFQRLLHRRAKGGALLLLPRLRPCLREQDGVVALRSAGRQEAARAGRTLHPAEVAPFHHRGGLLTAAATWAGAGRDTTAGNRPHSTRMHPPCTAAWRLAGRTSTHHEAPPRRSCCRAGCAGR